MVIVVQIIIYIGINFNDKSSSYSVETKKINLKIYTCSLHVSKSSYQLMAIYMLNTPFIPFIPFSLYNLE